MKRSVISIALIMMLALSCCFVSCEKGDTSDSTSDAQSQSQAESTSDVSLESSEEIKNGVFVEEIGNERITREYRDGENDYTVTTEAFFDDGSLHQKIVTDYKNKVIFKRTTSRYYEDGGYDNTIISFDDSGKHKQSIEEVYRGRYICKNITEFEVDKEEDLLGTREYYTASGEFVASGSLRDAPTDSPWTLVEYLDVFENGKLQYKQVVAYSLDLKNNLYQILDVDDKVLFSKETINGIETIVSFEPESFKVVTENGYSVYSDADGNMIAELDGSVIVKIGAGYDAQSIIPYIEERMSELQYYINLLISVT